MANLTTVGLTAGAGSSGTGSVSTLDNVIGAAGTANTNVQTVQGIASMTPLKVDGSGVTQPVSGTVAVTGIATAANQATEISSLSTIATNTGASLPAGTSLIGKVGIDQTSVGNTNAVSIGQVGTTTIAAGNGVSGTGVQRVAIASDNTPFAVNATGVDQYATHKEIAASQTAAVLGATGAIGDYLAYVVVYPGVAACGVVTILDAASTVGTFAGGGTTALPDLRPFTIPVGAFCTGAGWKITTGANVTVSGVGKFT